MGWTELLDENNMVLGLVGDDGWDLCEKFLEDFIALYNNRFNRNPNQSELYSSILFCLDNNIIKKANYLIKPEENMGAVVDKDKMVDLVPKGGISVVAFRKENETETSSLLIHSYTLPQQEEEFLKFVSRISYYNEHKEENQNLYRLIYLQNGNQVEMTDAYKAEVYRLIKAKECEEKRLKKEFELREQRFLEEQKEKQRIEEEKKERSQLRKLMKKYGVKTEKPEHNIDNV